MIKAALEGKVALITGAAVGIGAACAMTLAAEGTRVILTDIDEARGNETAAAIQAKGGEARFHRHDVTDEARWIEIVTRTEEEFGRLDALVSNAGIGLAVPVIDMTLADWRRQNAINLDGVFLSCKHCIPPMRRTGGGSIVLTSSAAGLRGAPGMAGYSATKGAVRLFGKSLAMECGPVIRVNTIHPGIIDTSIWSKIPVDAENPKGKGPMDARALARSVTPLSRPGTVDDVAQAVLWLVSDASSYVSGAGLAVDGGMTAGNFFSVYSHECRRAGPFTIASGMGGDGEKRLSA
jgi:NAD(P)-dependent dehydrogenase (short-subunit alcohol dehydrogenase family)